MASASDMSKNERSKRKHCDGGGDGAGEAGKRPKRVKVDDGDAKDLYNTLAFISRHGHPNTAAATRVAKLIEAESDTVVDELRVEVLNAIQPMHTINLRSSTALDSQLSTYRLLKAVLEDERRRGGASTAKQLCCAQCQNTIIPPERCSKAGLCELCVVNHDMDELRCQLAAITPPAKAITPKTTVKLDHPIKVNHDNPTRAFSEMDITCECCDQLIEDDECIFLRCDKNIRPVAARLNEKRNVALNNVCHNCAHDPLYYTECDDVDCQTGGRIYSHFVHTAGTVHKCRMCGFEVCELHMPFVEDRRCRDCIGRS
jgi:hypothetical protein